MCPVGVGPRQLRPNLFGEPRAWLPGIVESFPGPNGPVRAIVTNGNHGTIDLQDLDVPLVLAEITFVVPLSTAGWHDTWRFVSWLAVHNGVRLFTSPLGQRSFSRFICVADTPAARLVAHYASARVALDTYQTVIGRPLTPDGGAWTSELRTKQPGVSRPSSKVRGVTMIAVSTVSDLGRKSRCILCSDGERALPIAGGCFHLSQDHREVPFCTRRPPKQSLSRTSFSGRLTRVAHYRPRRLTCTNTHRRWPDGRYRRLADTVGRDRTANRPVHRRGGAATLFGGGTGR